MRLPLFLFLFLFLAMPGFAESAPRDPNAGCLRCHAMTNLAFRDPATGGIRELFVDKAALRASIHGDLGCIDCHSRTYRRYPHPQTARGQTRDCVGCHEDDDPDGPYRIDRIHEQFQDSVHLAPEAEGRESFGCPTCHNPHRFRPARIGDPLPDIVWEHNAVCLSCHADPPAGLADRHDAWLPNRAAHWRAARCVDCHTPADEDANHRILPAAESARDCVGCHSREAQLLNRLYAFRTAEEAERRDWLSRAILNEAYLIGISRSPTLDRLGLIALGLTLLVLIAHGLGRYLTGRSRDKGTRP